MRRIGISLAALVILGGCGEVAGDVRTFAEDAHASARRQAASARQRSEAREAQIAEKAQIIQEKDAIALGERYFLRAEGQGWTVVDRYTGQAGSIGYERLTDMSIEDATEAMTNLKLDEQIRASR